MSEAMQQAKRPVVAVAGPYGHPLHPILVTVPIGCWVASLVFDIASHLVDQGGFLAHGSRWLVGLGILGAVAAAVFGLLDFAGIPERTRVRRLGVWHLSLNLAITAAFALNLFWRPGTYQPDQATPAGPLLLSVVSLAALGVSGYLGGMLAYRYGVRVADEAHQADGYDVDQHPS